MFYKIFFPSDRDVMYVQTVHYVHTLASQSQRWDAAAMYGETILPAFRSADKILKYFCHLQIFSPQTLLRAQHGRGGGAAGAAGPGAG